MPIKTSDKQNGCPLNQRTAVFMIEVVLSISLLSTLY